MYKDKQIVYINNRKFIYDEFYDRLEAHNHKKPAIACSKCKNTEFSISYGDYKCIANCKCGHYMTVYDG